MQSRSRPTRTGEPSRLTVEKGERAGIGDAGEKSLERRREELVIRRSRFGGFDEECHRGAELEVVGKAEDVIKRAVLDLEEQAGAFAKAPAKGGVSEIGAGFLEGRDREMLRGRTGAEAANLRKNEPHPVRGFAAVVEFADNVFVDAGLGIEESLKVVEGRS